MAFIDEPAPRKKLVHELGQDLSALSVHELDERMEQLAAEIERLRQARATKQAGRAAADAVFKF
ncbi:MAG: DUF1192 domain-containing protein [Hyphomicrobiaceae bacterium]|nr:DUF1192 domain-containing protein [Hyphomicrobiaceae bacterium]